MDLARIVAILILILDICKGCGVTKTDIIFVTDESGSVGELNFNRTKEALRDTVAILDIESGNVRVGIMCFQSGQRTIYDLDWYSGVSDMQVDIMAIDYERGGTKIGSAMRYTRERMFDSTKGDRSEAENIMVVLTDGRSNDDEYTEADSARNANIRVISVGIGNNVDNTMLRAIAYDSSHYLQTDYSNLATTLAAFVEGKVTCPYYCDPGEGYERGGDISRTSSIYSTTGSAYVLMDTSSALDCCGRVESWTFFPRRSGLIYFQIWHPVSGNDYKLTGVNSLYVPENMLNRRIKYNVPDNERITINSGDKMGWYSPGEDMIPYGTLCTTSHYAYRFSFGNSTRGTTYSFASPTMVNGSVFAMKINLENETSDMWFMNSGRNVHLYENTPIGTSVYQVIVGQRDQEDLNMSMTDSSGKFSLDTETGIIYINDTLENEQTYVLYFSAYDTCGGNSISGGNLSVTVSNTPPHLPLPTSTTVAENPIVNTTFYLLEVDDETDTNVTCSIDSVEPSSATSLFFLSENTSSSYNVMLVANPGLDYETRKKYFMQISCTDGKNPTVSGTLNIYLTRNVRPRLINIPETSVAFDVSYDNATNITHLATLEATDPDSTNFTYNMGYCGPDSCPVWILNTTSGVVEFNESIPDLWSGGFNVGFSVTDEKTESEAKYLPVRLYGFNHNPSHVSLPTINNIIIKETIPTNQYLYTVSFYDIDMDILNVTYNITDDDWTYFTIKDNTDIYTSDIQINYESLSRTSYYIEANLTDGTNTTTEGLWIYVRDQNEPPTFRTSTYSVSADEGPAGTQLTPYPPPYRYTDLDPRETHTFTYDCGDKTRFFSFNTATGAISFARTIDVDTGGPTYANCSMKLYDSSYFSETVLLEITINDINDNSPKFDQNFYTFPLSPEAEIGTVVGIISVTDADNTSPSNVIGQIWFESLTVNATGHELFTYDNATSIMKVAKVLSPYWYGDYLEFVVKARDLGSTPLETSASVIVLFKNTTVEEPVSITETPYSLKSDFRQAIWMTAAGMGALTTIGFGVFMTYKTFTCTSSLSGGVTKVVNVSSAPTNTNLPSKGPSATKAKKAKPSVSQPRKTNPSPPTTKTHEIKPKKELGRGRDKVFRDHNIV